MNLRSVLIMSLAVVLAGCGAATTPSTRTSADVSLSAEDAVARDAVARRAQSRWDAILAKDYGVAYDYLTPGTRLTTPYDAYERRMSNVAIRWTNARVRSVECDEPEVCKATVDITYTVHAPGAGNVEGFMPVYERWLLSDGQWHHLPETTGR